jgi:Icc-related predicted phosphoesterase
MMFRRGPSLFMCVREQTDVRVRISVITVEIDRSPYHYMDFLNAGPGRTGAQIEKLPFLKGTIMGVPDHWPPIVAIADLQGRSEYGDTQDSLVGCRVAEELSAIHESAELPYPMECLGLLAGDFYTVPNAKKRGGTGDVRLVWQMMAETFADVWGVAGNHDTFRETGHDYRSLSRPPHNCLDGNVINWYGLKIGGVSGSISGSNEESRKKTFETYSSLLEEVLLERPDILILHVPPFVDKRNVGSEMVRDKIVEWDYEGLVICGHCPWENRVHTIGKSVCLNAHEAVISLTPSE